METHRGALVLLFLVAAPSVLPECRGSVELPACPPDRIGEEVRAGAPPRLVCEGSCEGTCRRPGGPGGLLLGRPVDLNEATAADLEGLPGIGPGLARRIVEERERGGPFGSLEDLARVKGLGAVRIARLRGWAVARAR